MQRLNEVPVLSKKQVGGFYLMAILSPDILDHYDLATLWYHAAIQNMLLFYNLPTLKHCSSEHLILLGLLSKIIFCQPKEQIQRYFKYCFII